MTEIGIIASVLQVADIGLRLSLRLYTFGETVAGADKSIISISENVSLTSTVLKELGQTLDKDQTSRICSPNAVRTADGIVKQCQKIFQEMDHVLVKKFANIKSTAKDRRIKAAQILERLRWPFIKGKIELLTGDLERQKSTLVLMLNVIALAKQEHEKTGAFTVFAEQRSLIQDLARSNDGYMRKFEQLKLNCEDVPIHQEVISADCNNSMSMPRVPTAQDFASTPAIGAASQRELSNGAQDLRPESYQGLVNTSGVPPPDRMSRLLQQHSNLLNTLLEEVSAPKYEIAEGSRSRIKTGIVTTHSREMLQLKEAQYAELPRLGEPTRRYKRMAPPTNPAQPRARHQRPSAPTRKRKASSSPPSAERSPGDAILHLKNESFENDNTEDRAANVVDELLAKWTTLPVPASASQDSFSV